MMPSSSFKTQAQHRLHRRLLCFIQSSASAEGAAKLDSNSISRRFHFSSSPCHSQNSIHFQVFPNIRTAARSVPEPPPPLKSIISYILQLCSEVDQYFAFDGPNLRAELLQIILTILLYKNA